jgi:uncharacterized protein YfaT (DUF1175 family)
MVHRKYEDVLFLLQLKQAGAQQRAAREVKGLVRFGNREALRGFVTLRFR